MKLDKLAVNTEDQQERRVSKFDTWFLLSLFL